MSSSHKHNKEYVRAVTVTQNDWPNNTGHKKATWFLNYVIQILKKKKKKMGHITFAFIKNNSSIILTNFILKFKKYFENKMYPKCT